MGELIRIGAPEGAAGLGATVDTTGAWVVRFGTPELDVFKERFTNESDRYRGGAHWCSHGFGEAVDPPHGDARNKLWTPVKSRSPVMNARPGMPAMGVIMEWMPGSESSCEGLRHTLEMSIIDRRALRTELVIKNEDGQRVEAIAPGFHPYLNVDDNTTEAQVLSIYRPDEVGQAVVLTRIDAEAEHRGEEKIFTEKLILGDNTTYVESNMMTTVTWSDDPSNYVCFEPTQAGASLKPDDGAVLLKRGEEKRFFVSVKSAGIEERAPRLS